MQSEMPHKSIYFIGCKFKCSFDMAKTDVGQTTL